MLDILSLDAESALQFSGAYRDVGTSHVFGGHLLAQALAAATRTVPAHLEPNSFHAYFLAAGRQGERIAYRVECVRDGRSFSAREISAVQGAREILRVVASFHAPQRGVMCHQAPMPTVEDPESFPSDLARQHGVPPGARLFPAGFGELFDIRTADRDDVLSPKEGRPAEYNLWIKPVRPVPDPVASSMLLAYISDYGLLRSALLPYGMSFRQPQVRAASVDHAMWFHRRFTLDDWLLCAVRSPVGSADLALCQCSYYTRDGTLIASASQQGLVRVG